MDLRLIVILAQVTGVVTRVTEIWETQQDLTMHTLSKLYVNLLYRYLCTGVTLNLVTD